MRELSSAVNQYLNRIMENLSDGGKEEVDAEIPREVGVFRLSQRRALGGVSTTSWRMRYNDDVRVQRRNAKGTDEIHFIYFLNHGMDWRIHEEHTQMHVEAGEACMYRNTEFTTSAVYPGGTEMLFQSIQIPGKKFSELLELYFDSKEAETIRRIGLNPSCNLTITPAMYQVICSLQGADRYRGGVQSLYLDSRIMELLSLSFSEILKKEAEGTCRDICLTRTELKTMEEIKSRIDAEPGAPFASALLARESGLSLSRFTKAFTALFGFSPHAYIIDRRLEYAAMLLASGEMNVSQAATMSGYSNMSHFSAAFRKKYGVLPKDYGRA